MGALVTTKACLTCHNNQEYKIGDIRGGISISLSNSEYHNVIKDMKNRMLTAKIFIVLFFR